MEFKYVMMNDGMRDLPIIFPNQLVHEDVFKSMYAMYKRCHGKELKAVSAGTVALFPIIYCYGKSDTLKLKSRGEMDSDIIFLYNYQHGVYDPDGAPILKNLLRSKK